MYNKHSLISKEEYLYNLASGEFVDATHRMGCDTCGHCGAVLPSDFEYGDVCEYCGTINKESVFNSVNRNDYMKKRYR